MWSRFAGGFAVVFSRTFTMSIPDLFHLEEHRRDDVATLGAVVSILCRR